MPHPEIAGGPPIAAAATFEATQSLPPDLVIVNDNGGDSDGYFATAMAMSLRSGFKSVSIIIAGPEVMGADGRRDVEGSNERQLDDAARMQLGVERLGDYFGIDSSAVRVFYGLDRGDSRTRGLRHVIPPATQADIAKYNLWPEEVQPARDRLAGGYDAAVRHIAGLTGPVHLMIGCSPSEAVALLNDLPGTFVTTTMQGSHKKRSLYYGEFSYNGDSDPEATYELIARFGSHLISSAITRDPALAYEDSSHLERALGQDAPDFLIELVHRHRRESDERNKGRQPKPGQIARGRVMPVTLHDGLAVLLSRGLAVPGAENPFRHTRVDSEQTLRDFAEHFYPEHITPEFLARLGHAVVDGQLAGNFTNLPPSYDVASIADVDAEAVHRLTADLLAR